MDESCTRNNLERLIKLDKKNGNFDIQDENYDKKLKIRTFQNNYQNEHTLQYFWRHINQTYFRSIGQDILDRLEYIDCILDTNIHQDSALMKHIQLSQNIYNIGQSFGVNKQLTNIYNKKQLTIQTKDEINQLTTLNNQLNDIYKSKNASEIDNQIQLLENEYQDMNHDNVNQIIGLRNKLELERSVDNNKKTKKNKLLRQTKSILLDYLRSILLKLDSKQMADSITKITNAMHSQYGIQFELAFNSNIQLIDQQQLLSLNELRDQSLFTFYNIPQKTRFSHIASNVTLFISLSCQFLGIQMITSNRLKHNLYQTRSMESALQQHSNSKIDPVINKFDCCHHCRMLFREEYLITCNYHSATMGLPIVNSTPTDVTCKQNLYQYIKIYQRYILQLISEIYIVYLIYFFYIILVEQTSRPNRRRSIYSIYNKKNGEFICNRKYCRFCLKQNYEQNMSDQKSDWVCPFCQGICYCSRCQRNDLIIRLKNMFISQGGDINELNQEFIFEKYTQLQQQEPYKRKQQYNNEQFKQELQTFKYMQQIRLDFENLRLISSSINKREKLKQTILIKKRQIWENDKIEVKEEEQEEEEQIVKRVYKKNKNLKKWKKQMKINEKNERMKRAQTLLRCYFKSLKQPREIKQLLLQHDILTSKLLAKKLKLDKS